MDSDEHETRYLGPSRSGGKSGSATTEASGPGGSGPPVAREPLSGNVLPPGYRLHEFVIESTLGEGGFGIVYLAHDVNLRRLVAIKEFMPAALATRSAGLTVVVKSEQHRDTFDAAKRSFINEAQLLAQFDHPALVKVLRFWEENGTAYMVMPHYRGVTLKNWVRTLGSKPSEAELLRLVDILLEPLEQLHARNIFHRDIAPDNILLLENGQPILLDFGAARQIIGDMTQALTVILKAGYAPMEQYADVPSMRQGPWTDIYSFAAVLYFCVLGRPPPPAVGRMVNDSYEPISVRARGQYSQRFLAAIDRSLGVQPRERPANIAEFRRLLGLAPLDAEAARPKVAPHGDQDATIPAEGKLAVRTGAPAKTGSPSKTGTPLKTGAPAKTSALEKAFAPEKAVAAERPAAPEKAAAAEKAAVKTAPRVKTIQPVKTAAPPKAAATPTASTPAKIGAALMKSPARFVVIAVAGVALILGIVLATRTSHEPEAPVPAPQTESVPAPTPVAPPAPAAAVAEQPPPSPAPAPVAPVTTAPPVVPKRVEPFALLREVNEARVPSFVVQLKQPDHQVTFGKGESVRLLVRSARPGYLYVLRVGPEHALEVLLPTGQAPAPRVPADREVELPPLATTGTVGAAALLVLVAEQPLTLTTSGQSQPARFDLNRVALARATENASTCTGLYSPCGIAYGSSLFQLQQTAEPSTPPPAIAKTESPPPPAAESAPPKSDTGVAGTVSSLRVESSRFAPDMVVISGGSFQMGSPREEVGRFDDEGPMHQVTVKTFALGKTPVTRAQFAAFVRETSYQAEAGCWTLNHRFWGENKWEKANAKNWRDPGFEQNDNHPVVCVSYDDALAFAQWLSKKTNKPYRLPTEAEWEYAARAGSSTARPWGDNPDRACEFANVGDLTAKEKVLGASTWEVHHCADGYAYTAPVGSFRPNAFGLQDMLGNVWQWVADCYQPNYTGAPADGSAWTVAGCSKHALRGGSWLNLPANVRSANRYGNARDLRYFNYGFRLAMSP
jgi:formylglycine-generating enzyme required for sulfatase activity/serine/threonine protein kinase